MEEEVWKDIKDFPNYQVSNYGRVRSVDQYQERVSKYGKKYYKFYKGKILAIKDIRGYKNVGLSVNGKVWTKQIHRLVMTTFKPIPNMGEFQVNHIDGNKSNNRIDNLEWVTPLENIHHAYDIGLNKKREQNGSKNLQAKLTEEQVKQIKYELLDKMSDKDIAEMFGVCRQSINGIRRGITWKHI